MVTQDYSDLSKALFDYSIFLITSNRYIKYDKKNFSLDSEWKNLTKDELSESKYPFRLFWIHFSLGVECLMKSVLLKHECDIFKLSKNKPVRSNSLLSKWYVSANSNIFIHKIMADNNINKISDMNSIVFSVCIENLEELFEKLDYANSKHILSQLKQLKNERRNNDLHMFFKQCNFMDNNDLINYIDAINGLLECN